MSALISLVVQVAASPVTSLVLILLLFFNWYKQHAKEQSIKNYLFSIRRMLGRIQSTPDAAILAQKAPDLIDALDATLATLDARPPFTDRIQAVLDMVRKRFASESTKELERLPNEVESRTQ